MNVLEGVDGLSECIGQAIQEHLAKANIAWPQIDNLDRPMLRVEAFIEEAEPARATVPRAGRVASVRNFHLLRVDPENGRYLGDPSKCKAHSRWTSFSTMKSRLTQS